MARHVYIIRFKVHVNLIISVLICIFAGNEFSAAEITVMLSKTATCSDFNPDTLLLRIG